MWTENSSVAQPRLVVDSVQISYGHVIAVNNCSLTVREGSVSAVVGRNGAGKTSLMKGLVGHAPVLHGSVQLDGKEIVGIRTHKLAKMGLVHVPEGRHVFGQLSVYENLRIAAANAGRLTGKEWHQAFAEACEYFPRLYERRKQQAKSLSGGEQQMLAIARALVSRPKVIILDEPSMGLSPAVANVVFEVIAKLAEGGLAVLVAEQNLALAAGITETLYVLDRGRVSWSGSPRDLDEAGDVAALYFGGGMGTS